MAVGVLGILKAGGAYLPLNQEHPVARLAHQARESGAPALVTQEALLGRLPDFADVVCLDRDRTELDALDANAPDPVGGPDDLVYVIYTSGSTGAPKGVSVTHRNLSNYIGDIVGRLGAEGKAWVFGMVTAISTDLGNTAFFPALASGGTLALVRPETAVDPAAFVQRFEDSPLDVLKITPSHLHALLAANDGRLLPREWLVLGGERLGWDLVDRVRSLATCRILNHYGPTETTIGSCTMLVGDGRGVYHSATVPIGGPIANTRAYVLDDTLLPVPLDVPGRLFIGGAGVARGYIGQADLTTERFLPDSFAAVADARMYDTGDLARRLPDGTLEFLGRVDEQVKIRGFRVEPSEIEAALRNHPAVENAAVIAVEDTPGDIRLVAYCAVTANASADDLRGHLSEWVPEFMVPSAFVMLDTLPLTPSGKVDRLALPDLAQPASGVEEEYVAPRTAVEEAVAAIWADVLGVERVSVEADFFALGGHSLLATQVVAQVRTDFAIELPLHSLFMCPTVALLSEEIVGLLGAAEQDETASLLAELEGLSDEEASRLVQELAQGDEAG
jgi:amino acid adenylation domain-containing protein